MLALVKTKKGVGNIELQEVPVPEINENEVLIEVKAAGVCGTDIHIRHDQFPYWPPVILGHEFSGIIVKAGKQVKNWQEGDLVVGEPHTKACGYCYYCRTGNIQICPEKRSPGWGIDGAFAKFIKMPPHLLHRVPNNINFEEAALTEILANVVHDVLERGKVEPSDFVVVTGPGTIGLFSAVVAQISGARKVMIIGTDKDEAIRLPAAKKMGIDYVVNSQKENPVELVMEKTNGLGADLIVEASGAESAINLTVDLIRKKGRIAVIGITGKEKINFPWDKAIFKVCDIHFNLSTSYTSWERALFILASKTIKTEVLITHRESLTNWEKVFDDIEHKKGIKGLLYPC